MGRFVNKLEQLKFAVYCFKQGKDTRFMNRVLMMKIIWWQ